MEIDKETNIEQNSLKYSAMNNGELGIRTDLASNVVPSSQNGSPTRRSPRSKAVMDFREQDSDNEDDFKTNVASVKNSGKKMIISDDEDDEEDRPLKETLSQQDVSMEDAKVKEQVADDEDEDFEVPKKKKKRNNNNNNLKKKKKRKVEDDESEDSDVPLSQQVKTKEEPKEKKPNAKKSKIANKKVKKEVEEVKTTKTEESPKKEAELAEQEDDETYKWWLEANLDNSVKWNTLEHNGVWFPPAYKPHGVKMKYDGIPISLSPASEEVAGFFAALVGTQYAENPTFCKNFFADFMEILRENDPDCPIKDFEKCDFTPMTEYFAQQKELKKAMSKVEKEKIKEEKKKIDEHFAWAIIDGRKEKVGNFRIEPPGLFRGRGDHPKTGKLKRRVWPEDITINLGKEAKIPDPPEGHTWGGVVHDNTVAWLATWTENVNGNIKYVMFAATSSLKGMSDFKKFEKARELKQLIKTIRATYTEELKDKVMLVRQRATALWLIDRLALRAGNEKGEDEADTVGCCSLRYEHVELEEEEAEVNEGGDTRKISRKMVVFDFLEVDPVVWKNLKIFKREPKAEGDPIFDRLTTNSLNKHLTNLMPGLTAKVFRTFNASSTFQEELKKTRPEDSVHEKILSYNRANRQVAILCNHQRTVSKAHGAQMEKLSEKILALKYERWRVRQACFKLEPKLPKKRPDIAEDESDMDEAAIERKHNDYVEGEKLKLEKKYQKMCEKAAAEGEEVPEKPVFVEKALPENMEKLEKKFESLTQRIAQARTQMVDKDENKTTALGTSKINYIDPRITVAWCKSYDVPIEKMFTKTLREKFTWAMDVDEDWKF